MGASGGFLQKKQKCPPMLGRQVKVLLRDGDGTHRAGLCGFHGGGYGVGRQLAGTATARMPVIWNTSGQIPVHWVQPMQRSGSTNAFMGSSSLSEMARPSFNLRSGL